MSRALVSIVVRDAPGASEQSRERVRAAAADLGYRPDSRARLLSRSRSRLLGVVFGVQHPFHGDLVEGIYLAAEKAGYEVALSAVTPTRTETRATETLLDDRCEALILLGPQLPTRQLSHLAHRLPVVVVARNVKDPNLDVVRTADDDGLRLTVDHLVELGHRDIVHIDGGRAASAAERRRGYRTAMRRHGLFDHICILPGGLTEEAGAAAARQLLDGPALPSAAAVFNDSSAIGVLDTLLRAGLRVPEDISLVGYDDSRQARLAPINLTTIGQNTQTMAELTVTRAIARLTREDESASETVTPPTLIVRGSTAPPIVG